MLEEVALALTRGHLRPPLGVINNPSLDAFSIFASIGNIWRSDASKGATPWLLEVGGAPRHLHSPVRIAKMRKFKVFPPIRGL